MCLNQHELRATYWRALKRLNKYNKIIDKS